ncbi:MAG: hypothetical protein ACRDO8_06860 [Nocardioidaceae bacterium]
MRRIVAAAAVGTMLVSAVTACTESDADPGSDPTTTVKAPPASTVVQHETGVGSPIGYGLSVPDGAAQLGPLVRRRSPELIEAYQKVLDRYEKQKAREQAKENGGENPTETTPTPNPFPTEDTFGELDQPPEPDITTALLRVDDDPGKVFEDVLGQVAKTLPGLGVDPEKWSQYCEADHGLYTGCEASVSGRTVDDRGVRVTITLDPGNVETMTAPAGTRKNPVMSVTTESTDPIDTSEALPGDEPSPAPTTTPPSPPSPSPIAQGTPVDAKWPTMKRETPAAPGDPLLTNRWSIRDYTTLLLSGDDPAFAMMVTERRTNADAVARSYALAYSDGGEPRRDTVEDRTEISTTYTARTSENGPTVTSTYIQAGRGNYVALFYDPPTK